MTLHAQDEIYERTAVDRPADANLGPVRARRPESVEAMRAMHNAGVHVALIAEQFGVSVRTVYRYLDVDVIYSEVELDGWVAVFARARDRAPWRVTAWSKA